MSTLNRWIFFTALSVSCAGLIVVLFSIIVLLFLLIANKITLVYGCMVYLLFSLTWIVIINFPSWLAMRYVVRKEGLPDDSVEREIVNNLGTFYVKKQG